MLLIHILKITIIVLKKCDLFVFKVETKKIDYA